MNAKELKIEAPEGYEVDWDNSSNNVIRFKPIKNTITYQDICQELFMDKLSWRLTGSGFTSYTPHKIIYDNSTSTSNKQLEQLLALNRLMNVAKYLNGDWEPDFTDRTEKKWYIEYDFEDLRLDTDFYSIYRKSDVYFKSGELALQAIEILGEEEVKKALGIFES